jgi:hypothetical protein
MLPHLRAMLVEAGTAAMLLIAVEWHSGPTGKVAA